MSLDLQRYANSYQRTIVYKRDGGRCHYCGIRMSLKGFHVDHVIPWSRGGQTQIDNLVTSCYMCNGAKHTMAYESFKTLLSSNGLGWRRRRYFALRSRFATA